MPRGGETKKKKKKKMTSSRDTLRKIHLFDTQLSRWISLPGGVPLVSAPHDPYWLSVVRSNPVWAHALGGRTTGCKFLATNIAEFARKELECRQAIEALSETELKYAVYEYLYAGLGRVLTLARTPKLFAYVQNAHDVMRRVISAILRMGDDFADGARFLAIAGSSADASPFARKWVETGELDLTLLDQGLWDQIGKNSVSGSMLPFLDVTPANNRLFHAPFRAKELSMGYVEFLSSDTFDFEEAARQLEDVLRLRERQRKAGIQIGYVVDHLYGFEDVAKAHTIIARDKFEMEILGYVMAYYVPDQKEILVLAVESFTLKEGVAESLLVELERRGPASYMRHLAPFKFRVEDVLPEARPFWDWMQTKHPGWIIP